MQNVRRRRERLGGALVRASHSTGERMAAAFRRKRPAVENQVSNFSLGFLRSLRSLGLRFSRYRKVARLVQIGPVLARRSAPLCSFFPAVVVRKTDDAGATGRNRREDCHSVVATRRPAPPNWPGHLCDSARWISQP